MSQDRKDLGERLREAREYLGLSQDEVARAIKIPRPAVSLIESGQRGVDALELSKFANLYQRPVSELAGDAEKPGKHNEAVAFLARAAQKLTKADQAELVRFAEFLAAKKGS